MYMVYFFVVNHSRGRLGFAGDQKVQRTLKPACIFLIDFWLIEMKEGKRKMNRRVEQEEKRGEDRREGERGTTNCRRREMRETMHRFGYPPPQRRWWVTERSRSTRSCCLDPTPHPWPLRGPPPHSYKWWKEVGWWFDERNATSVEGPTIYATVTKDKRN